MSACSETARLFPIMRSIFAFAVFVFFVYTTHSSKSKSFLIDESSSTENTRDSTEEDDEEDTSDINSFLYKRLREDAVKRRQTPIVYTIPGPQEPLPGRSHSGDYWPVFPFQNQFSGGLDLDPSISRHIGGDLNIAVPSWGILDIYGRFFNRIHDTTTKFGYINHPVNMLDLEKEDFVELMSNPSMHWNRAAQPTLSLGKVAKSYVPLSCKPPLCNPYHSSIGFGVEQDRGGNDGVEGDIDVPIPISKGVAYRFPFAGKIYYAYDNTTITYGQNLSPVDPFSSLFDYQKNRPQWLAIPRDIAKRTKRDVDDNRNPNPFGNRVNRKYFVQRKWREEMSDIAIDTPFYTYDLENHWRTVENILDSDEMDEGIL